MHVGPTPEPPARQDEYRSARKRRAILEAATEVFLRKGYLGASMDEIAALARVSKQTTYKHFSDKRSLFSEIVTSAVDEAADPVHDEIVELEQSTEVEVALRRIARQLLRRVMQPRILQLRRLVIAEAARFPDLGRTFYEQGPGRTMISLAEMFQRLAARGALRLDDSVLAAAHFNWLVMSIPLNQAMLLGEDQPATPTQLDTYADAGVTAFLGAYGQAQRVSTPTGESGGTARSAAGAKRQRGATRTGARQAIPRETS